MLEKSRGVRSVEAEFVIDQFKGHSSGLDLGLDLESVPFEEGSPFGLGALALLAELAVVPELLDTHARLAQASQHLHPQHILDAVAPMAAAGSSHGFDQALTLVVAQCVDRDSPFVQPSRRGSVALVPSSCRQ